MFDSLFNEVTVADVITIKIKQFQAEMNAVPSPTLVSPNCNLHAVTHKGTGAVKSGEIKVNTETEQGKLLREDAWHV